MKISRAAVLALASLSVLLWQPASDAKKQQQPTRMTKLGDEVVSVEAGELFAKAQESINSRQLDQAAEFLKQFLASYPNSGAGHYKYAYVLLQQGKSADALDHAKLCTKSKPAFFGGWALLGEAAENLKLDDQAKAAYEKALAIQSTGENADIIREHLNDMTKQSDEVIATAAANKQITAKNQEITNLNQALALCDQANALIKQGQFAPGLQACREALEKAPDAAQVKENVVVYLNNYAAECVQKQELKQAEELMKEALAVQSKGGVSANSQRTTLKNYSTLLKFQERNDEAKQIENKMSALSQ